jgi:hypothetical protein
MLFGMVPVIFGNTVAWMGLAVAPRKFFPMNLADSLATLGLPF